MARRSLIPPAELVPTPGAVQAKLNETQLRVRELRALLTFSLRVHGKAARVDVRAAQITLADATRLVISSE